MPISKAAYAITKARIWGLRAELMALTDDSLHTSDKLERAKIEQRIHEVCVTINSLTTKLQEF